MLIVLQVAWTPRNTVLYPAICSIAGLVAGMFGVGGGIVKVRTQMVSLKLNMLHVMHDMKHMRHVYLLAGTSSSSSSCPVGVSFGPKHDDRAQAAAPLPQGPLMLEMGMLPDVAAATSATMIM